MALNSSSYTPLIAKTPEKIDSSSNTLKKVSADATKTTEKTPEKIPEKAKKDKKPALKSKKKTSRLSWSSEHNKGFVSSVASSPSATPPVLTSDPRFPPLITSYKTPPTAVDWRRPLRAQSSLTNTTVSTTTTTNVQQYPPTVSSQAAVSATASLYSYPPVRFPPGASPRPVDRPSPRRSEKTQTASTNPSDSEQAQDANASSLTINGKSADNQPARKFFSALQRDIEHLLWHPSPSAYQQLGATMQQINLAGLDFEAIDASSLVLRMLVDPGKENLDPVIAWIAKLGCQLVSGARSFGLDRSSVLELAVARGWPMTITAVTEILHEENSLREHTRNMLLRAMQADKPLSLLEKALQFSADHCALEDGITAKMIVSLSKSWQTDPDNELHSEKFVAVFEATQRQNLDIIPIATLLQVATKFHHAPMALTMLRLNANTEYRDENDKTVTDLALEAQQALIEKIGELRVKKYDMDPANYQTEMDECLTMLRSNRRIMDALDAIESTKDTSSSE